MVLEVVVELEHLVLSSVQRVHDSALLIVANPAFEEVGLRLKRDEVHEVEWVRNHEVLFLA